jgi:23S rRNA (cytosine1962-C5)-methyltransferase
MQEEVKPWDDYELLDTGGGEKLERFGKHILRRPEPQAIWPKSLPEQEWESRAQASFFRSKGNAESGNWIQKPGMPERWFCRYERGNLKLQYKLALSSFKHVGIFPEQSANWDYLNIELKRISTAIGEYPKVLNLFAYTGLASLAACASGAQVTHVDAVKQVVSWARENMESSSLDGIRWLADDALKFVKREERRGNRYHCIILDPPAYGRGPDGEKWLLEEHLPELMAACSNILEKKNHCLILNLYSMGFSSLIAENLVKTYFPESQHQSGELFFFDAAKRKLPLGIFSRCSG